jgi:hypothetical protein
MAPHYTPSSPERLKKLGLVHELEEKLRRLVNRAQGVCGSLGDSTFMVDPQNPWVIDGQKVMDYARELYDVLKEGQALRDQIAALKSDLGID